MQASLFIKSLRREAVPRTPVWIMRQAGRYLPEYRQVRAKAKDFMTLCQTPELACEVTLQPLRRFALDAAIVFSDILTIPDAMGLGLSFEEGSGPRLARPIRSLAEIQALPSVNIVERLNYVMQTVQWVRQAMPSHLPLIGFSGSPWTLACYMIQGESSRDFKQALRFMYKEPAALHQLLETLSTIIMTYLAQQVAHGANALMLFDTWGGLLSHHHFVHFSCHYMRKIVQYLKQQCPDIPLILFTKGGGQWLKILADTGCDGLGVDWTVDLRAARVAVNNRVCLQGNLDPIVLLTDPHCIRSEVQSVLDNFGQGSGHVFNLGHGITPDVPPEHVDAMIAAVAELSPGYHSS